MGQWTTFRWGAVHFAVTSTPTASRPEPSLTGAEREVMALLLEGKTNAQIAKARKTAVRTVANQIASLFRKYGVGSRAELAARVHS
ncbi:MAG: helix-turn-helix transcriptional regulator [Myxococcaceae bacterium]|nr:helix-turn-helix transcriptional regulator [Myxococcaceae bacterium]